MEGLLAFDYAILNWIQYTLRCPAPDSFFQFVSRLGDGGFIWIVAGIGLTVSKRYRKIGICVLFTLLAATIVGEFTLKPLFARARPTMDLAGLEMLVNRPGSFSFPSGHTTSSFASACVLTGVNKSVGAAAYVLAALIGFSRMYLYVHFPTDILGGILCGTLVAMVCRRLFQKIEFVD